MSLYKELAPRGFEILGFPCNQFGSQEPGSNQEIQEFCAGSFAVDFPMHAKVEVNGDNADPLYKYLKEQAPGILGSRAIKWNFTKFLVDREGKVLKRYAPATKPEDLKADIEAQMG